MHLAHNHGRLRRGSAFALLGVVLTVIALSLSQCRMVDERLTGVAVSPAKANSCLTQCQQVFQDSVRSQVANHAENSRACAGDSICLALEAARWEALMARFKADRIACQTACQHQGSGGGR
jgi:hypothetical protein